MEPSSPLRKLPFMGPSKPVSNTNDAFKFQIGVNFKAKLIGVEAVPEPRGDRMCQEVIQKQKAYVKALGTHKQQIFVNVSLEGIKLVDLRTQETIHHHPVQRISFISRDVSDARAFGYIYGPGDGTHKFFGLKTERAAENLVLTLRDLFQVVFEMKKKEAEEEKKKKTDNKENSEPNESKPAEKTPEETKEETKETSSEDTSSGLLDLVSLGLEPSEQQNNIFDPMAGDGGVAAATSGPFPASQTSNDQFGFGGSDPFAATQPQAPTNLPFNAPAQSGWATFSPQNQMPPAFPQTSNRPVNQNANAMFGAPTGGFGRDPFGAASQASMGGGMQAGMTGGNMQGGISANWGTMQNSSNPFNSSASANVFGADTSMATNGSSVNSAFAASPLTPTSTQVSQAEPPKNEKHVDMFAGLVDSFGVDFGAKKEAAPPPKINQLAAQQSSDFGNTVSDVNDSDNAFASTCPLAMEEEDPFDTASVNRPINVQEMEMAPNVFTKTISFSESENDITPDRDVPAPSLPPPPLPANVNKANFPDDVAPTPPPRPMNKHVSMTSTSTSDGLYSNVPDLSNHPHLCAAQININVRTSPVLTRGITVDLGNFPESPPPPPPRPGSRVGKQVSYPSLPRPHASTKVPLSPPIKEVIRQSPHSSPNINRQASFPSPVTSIQEGSPRLNRQPAISSSSFSDDFVGNRSPNLSRQTSGNSLPRTPPVNRHVTTHIQLPPVQTQSFEANFADFSNFDQQEQFPNIDMVSTHESELPPILPPRTGSGRKKAPMLSNAARSLTMPAPNEPNQMGTSERSQTPPYGTESKNNVITEEHKDKQISQYSGSDPFAVTLGKHHKTRNVNAAYARPRPKPRSKTPTLISTKTNLSVALRSDSPLSQNSTSSKEFETTEQISNSSRHSFNKADADYHSQNSDSPRELRKISSKESNHVSHPRTGTPVSMHSMQSASSGHSGEHVVDPFAHIDPFEINKETEDPFLEKDPFEGSDPFRSPTDPFGKDLNEAEFKTKAIAITADGVEVEESVINNNVHNLKVDPDPFATDPFNMVKDPFNEKAKIGLGQPLIRSHSKVDDHTVDPFDTAYAADTLSKTSFTPEFSNTFESGIAGQHSKGTDMFKQFDQNDFESVLSTVDNHQMWKADFNVPSSQSSLQQEDNSKNPKQYCTNSTSHVTDNFHVNQSRLLTHPDNVNLNQPQFSTYPCDSPSNQISSDNVVYHRERHESDSTSYNSEISEAFASNLATPSSLPSQQMNGRGTPGNPFLTNTTQNSSGNPPANTGGGSLLDF